MLLIDFSDSEASQNWQIINDGVMGGISHSHVELSKSSTLLFCGALSLEYNGGFVSIRKPVEPGCFKNCQGVSIKLKGDGRSYQFRVKIDDQYDGIAYRALFDTTSEWQALTLRFDTFQASFRGRILTQVPALKPEQIRQIGFLLADKQAGPFRLEIASIQTL